MFKKTLVFCLAVCMLSVNVFAGTAMLSMAADYSAIQGPVKEETVTVSPEAVEIFQSSDGSTQTITYYGADELSSTQKKTNTNSTASQRRWFYFRVPLNGLTSVTAASGSAGIRYNNGGTTFHLKSIDKATWETATKNLTSNTKTIASDSAEWLAVPDSTLTALWSKKLSSSTSSVTSYPIEDTRLTENINTAAENGEDYVYFTAYAYISTNNKDGCATTLNSWSFTLTGTKPIEGLSASFVQEETVTVQPEAVRVFENESTGTQTITYYSTDNLPTSQQKSNAQGTTAGTDTNKAWFYLKVPTSGLTSVTNASISAKLRFNNSGAVFHIKELSEDVWTSATSGLDADNKKTLTTGNNDSLLDAPTSGTSLCTQSRPSTGVTTSDCLEYTLESTALTEYINSTDNDYVYFAMYAIISNAGNDGGATILNSWSFTLTGTKPVEGTSINGNDFTYGVTVEAGETVRLVVGVYGAGDAFLGAEVSDAETSDGETVIELPVSLSTYTGATYIKAYMWESGTLVPYFAPIVKEVA